MIEKRDIPRLGMMVALTVALSIMFIIPIPATKGFVTLCEVGIYSSAILFGPAGGLWVGALSGGLIDLISGYPEWAIFSIIIHGLQGYIVGKCYQKFGNRGMYVGLGLGTIFMIVGYALATALLFGAGAGLASIPGNIVQNIFGIGVTIPLVAALHKVQKHHPQFK